MPPPALEKPPAPEATAPEPEKKPAVVAPEPSIEGASAAPAVPEAVEEAAPAVVPVPAPKKEVPTPAAPLVPVPSFQPPAAAPLAAPSKVAPKASAVPVTKPRHLHYKSRLWRAWNAKTRPKAAPPAPSKQMPGPVIEARHSGVNGNLPPGSAGLPRFTATPTFRGEGRRSKPAPRDQIFPAAYYSVPLTADVPGAVPTPPPPLAPEGRIRVNVPTGAESVVGDAGF